MNKSRGRRRPKTTAAHRGTKIRVGALFVLSLALLTSAGPSLAQTPGPEPEPEQSVEHVVLVWLKDPASTRVREALIGASLAFTAIEGVEDVRIGGPIESERPNVDDGFDLGIVVSLRDRDALAHYLAHPDHVRAGRELLAPEAARVLVYDVDVGHRATRAPSDLPESP